jgi:hypothetical protein
VVTFENLSDEQITSTLLQSEWLRRHVMFFSVTGDGVVFQQMPKVKHSRNVSPYVCRTFAAIAPFNLPLSSSVLNMRNVFNFCLLPLLCKM